MDSLKETISQWSFFWLLFIPLTAWVLGFYQSKSSSLIKRIWRVSLLPPVFLIPLFFLPWIPVAQGGQSGFRLAAAGDWWLVAYIALVFLSWGLLLSRQTSLLKAGASAHLLNSIYIFVVLVKLFPETIRLAWTDVAPIISVMVLLVGNVIVLLLWHELDKGFELKSSKG